MTNILTKLPNGSTIHTIDDAQGVVLANTGRGPQPWVTWEFEPGNRDNCYWGHYFETLAAAKADFIKRIRG